MGQIKINRARKLSAWGKYPETWAAIINAIPEEIKQVLSARQLAILIDANQKIYAAGKAYNQKEINDFFGRDFWKINWDNIDIDAPEPEQKYSLGRVVSHATLFDAGTVISTRMEEGRRYYDVKYKHNPDAGYRHPIRTCPIDSDYIIEAIAESELKENGSAL